MGEQNRRILVTGGAGFIGINLVQMLLDQIQLASRAGYIHELHRVDIWDKFTYAGQINRTIIEQMLAKYPNTLHLNETDICSPDLWEAIGEYDLVFHLAAESHVDRATREDSIIDFAMSNTFGTANLLTAVEKARGGFGKPNRIICVGTDEVYGSVNKGESLETTILDPSSPYSASKAGADLMALACYRTFGLPVIVTRCTNNFGPFQHPEKFIPRAITNLIVGEPIKLYGNGRQVRDWIYVRDHNTALSMIAGKGTLGQIYNISAGCRHRNITIARMICEIMDRDSNEWIKIVPDRPGHDIRYALNPQKLQDELDWHPVHQFRDALIETVMWYQVNQDWWVDLKGETEEMYKTLGR